MLEGTLSSTVTPLVDFPNLGSSAHIVGTALKNFPVLPHLAGKVIKLQRGKDILPLPGSHDFETLGDPGMGAVRGAREQEECQREAGLGHLGHQHLEGFSPAL